VSEPGLKLLRLVLGRFRNYAALRWQPEGRLVVVSGDNGSGKTNLLEAISFLAPGRGLRGARIGEVAQGGTGAWAVNGRLATPDGPAEIGTGTTEDNLERRVFRLDGAAPRSQAELAARIAAVWLTPQMDRLFQEGATGRRRFLDRLVYALEPGHARTIASHDTALAQRRRLLGEGRWDAAWLSGLEEELARHAVAATAARSALIGQLNAALAGGIAGEFPAARLELICPIATRLAGAPALAVEDWLRDALAAARPRDAAAGSASWGAQRADLGMADLATGLPTAQASTGQQKALLIGVILGHAALLAGARGTAPLLLLDEPAVHLDESRRQSLFAALAALPAQVFLTGTDNHVFAPLSGRAAFWRTAGNALHADPAYPRNRAQDDG
jgi:DNA replication and repair protein RecF